MIIPDSIIITFTAVFIISILANACFIGIFVSQVNRERSKGEIKFYDKSGQMVEKR